MTDLDYLAEMGLETEKTREYEHGCFSTLQDELDAADAALTERIASERAAVEQATNLLDAIFQTVDPEDGEEIVAEAFGPGPAPEWVLAWCREHPSEEDARLTKEQP